MSSNLTPTAKWNFYYLTMLNLLNATILGIVEGITEFLPISSTGHLILASKLLGITQTEFVKSFEIAIQLGAILSVFVLYWKKLLFETEVLKRVCVAFLPTAILGLAFYKLIKSYLIGNVPVVLWSLFLGGMCLIAFELLHKERPDAFEEIRNISYSKSFVIGLFQSVSMIPGVSRSAATIVGGLLVGMKRTTIVEFSFLLAIPTMAAATGLDLLKNASVFSFDQVSILAIGFIVSFFSALFAVKCLLAFIKKHTFLSFGIYRIAIVIIFLLFLNFI